jgi:Sodium/calcium exchanger protein
MAYPLLFIPLSLELRYLVDAPATWVFLTSAAAITVLADWIRRATEQLAERTGSTIGGLLNVSFGNTAELILAVFVLSAAQTRVVQAQIGTARRRACRRSPRPFLPKLDSQARIAISTLGAIAEGAFPICSLVRPAHGRRGEEKCRAPRTHDSFGVDNRPSLTRAWTARSRRNRPFVERRAIRRGHDPKPTFGAIR